MTKQMPARNEAIRESVRKPVPHDVARALRDAGMARKIPASAFPPDSLNAIVTNDLLSRDLLAQGFAFVHGSAMRALLESKGPLDDWQAFADSWNDLHLDAHMADGGRYRRRRHATYSIDAGGAISRCAHQPHYQSRAYNALNGGIERWFEPIEHSVGSGSCMTTILAWCGKMFAPLAAVTPRWHVEVHQFRIEAVPGHAGLPTPEGMHRDGVDHVLVLLVRRHNIASGTTSIYDLPGRELGRFTLTEAFDAALVEDTRVFHGVTAVTPIDPAHPAFRDVLVVTFKRT